MLKLVSLLEQSNLSFQWTKLQFCLHGPFKSINIPTFKPMFYASCKSMLSHQTLQVVRCLFGTPQLIFLSSNQDGLRKKNLMPGQAGTLWQHCWVLVYIVCVSFLVYINKLQTSIQIYLRIYLSGANMVIPLLTGSIYEHEWELAKLPPFFLLLKTPDQIPYCSLISITSYNHPNLLIKRILKGRKTF